MLEVLKRLLVYFPEQIFLAVNANINIGGRVLNSNDQAVIQS